MQRFRLIDLRGAWSARSLYEMNVASRQIKAYISGVLESRQ